MGILPARPWTKKGLERKQWVDKYGGPKSESKPKSVWIVVRHSNNTVWAGPWRGDGKRWTVVESKYGLFASKEAAEKSVESEYPPFNFRWDVFEL